MLASGTMKKGTRSSLELEASIRWLDEEMFVRCWIRRKRARTGQKHCSQEVMFDGIAGSSTARTDAQLVVERAHVGLDGEQANDELLGNLRVTQPLCHQAQHLHFAGRQSVGIGEQ